ncbi:MAG: hypothetical protein LBT51_09645 [Fusobacteriaceae bacterium]|jgi:hypothetical protein|nr:hypothetical protein [Fusobacteriaceae bacterium]
MKKIFMLGILLFILGNISLFARSPEKPYENWEAEITWKMEETMIKIDEDIKFINENYFEIAKAIKNNKPIPGGYDKWLFINDPKQDPENAKHIAAFTKKNNSYIDPFVKIAEEWMDGFGVPKKDRERANNYLHEELVGNIGDGLYELSDAYDKVTTALNE